MTTTAVTGNFFETLFEGAIEDIEKIFKDGNAVIISTEHQIALFGNAVVNEFKSLEGNPTIILAADFFVKIAEGIDPGLTPLISGIELEFPKIVNIATGVLGEVQKPESEQLSDALTAISATKAANSVLGSNILGGISAAVSAYVATNNATSVTVPTDAQLISGAQVIHVQAA